ncbi:MAG TPA: alpha/beta fold hydrolase [Bdellovibrionota bacterium]|nr:alpha/beta fold hydrolase [Bdellovibrionota bacterium]
MTLLLGSAPAQAGWLDALRFLGGKAGLFVLEETGAGTELLNAVGGDSFESFSRRLGSSANATLRAEITVEAARVERDLRADRIARGEAPEGPVDGSLEPADREFLSRPEESLRSNTLEKLAGHDETFFGGSTAGAAAGALAGAEAQFLSADASEAVEFSVDAANARLVGTRLPSPGRQPIILGHGVMESAGVWTATARRLQEMGYDVWMPNWRGHGRGWHRSIVRFYSKGDYGLEAMLDQDLPALLKHVNAETGMRPVLVGHSMGGMISRAAPEDLILARIEVGTPHDFRRLPLLAKIFARLGAPIPWTGSTVDALAPARWLKNILNGLASPAVAWATPDGLLRVSNVAPDEFSELIEQTVSPLHEDIIRDFGAYAVQGRGPERIALRDLARRGVRTPLLVVAGEWDTMAPEVEIIRELRDLPSDYPVWTATATETGHVDLVLGERAADRLAPLIDRFVVNRASFGPRRSHLLLP